MKKKRLQWHTAFQAALQIDFQEEQAWLQFHKEYNLTRKPLQIDVLVIKKEPGRMIRKNLGRIFRQYNIVEYKSPDDSLSINDFYKVMAYTCLYQANTEKVLEVPPDELTITFVSSHYPRSLVNFIKKQYHASVQKQFPGIYYVTGLLFPMQIVVNGQLPREENVWLSRLRRNLNTKDDVGPLAKAYKGREHHPLYSAAMDLIVQANIELYEEEKNMCDALRELFADELAERERTGFITGTEKGARKGELLQLISQVCKKLAKGQSLDTISDALESTPEQIAPIMEAAKDFAPDYDIENIYQVLTKG